MSSPAVRIWKTGPPAAVVRSMISWTAASKGKATTTAPCSLPLSAQRSSEMLGTPASVRNKSTPCAPETRSVDTIAEDNDAPMADATSTICLTCTAFCGRNRTSKRTRSACSRSGADPDEASWTRLRKIERTGSSSDPIALTSFLVKP